MEAILKGPKTLSSGSGIPLLSGESFFASLGTKTAVIYEHREVTYRELDLESNRIGRAVLQKARQVPNSDGDSIVAVCMPPSDKLVKCLLAIWKVRGAYLPLDVSFPESRVRHILEESDPVLVIYDGCDKSHNFEGFNAVSFDEIESLLEDDSRLERKFNDGGWETAIVLYTSGSTGVPKGVRISDRAIMNRLEWQWATFPYSETEQICVFKTALTFVDSVSEVWGPLCKGLTLVVVPKDVTKNPASLVSVLESHRIERLVLVPSLLRSILAFLSLQNDKRRLRNLRLWVCSGEALPVSLALEFLDRFDVDQHVLCNFYGSTEVMGDVTYFVCESKSQLRGLKAIPIGVPVSNNGVCLLDDTLEVVRGDSVGEMFVFGEHLALGYVKKRDPEKFVAREVEGEEVRLFRTGDFASIRDGTLFFEGRKDSQVKIRGHRVDLSEVEQQISGLPEVSKAVVLCYKAGELDQALVAFLVLKESRDTPADMESKLKTLLADYMVPQVSLLDAIPLLVNGKVDRQGLLKLYGNKSVEFDLSNVPESKLEEARSLLEVVKEVIGVVKSNVLSLESNFYELGGTSLNAILVVSELAQRGFSLGVTEFISARNLGEVLNRMTRRRGAEEPQWNFSNDLQLRVVPLKVEHKTEAIEIIAKGFVDKGQLQQWLKPNITYDDYRQVLTPVWEFQVEQGLSFVVFDKDDRMVGVSLNCDMRNEPPMPFNKNLHVNFECIEGLEAPLRKEKLPQGLGEVLYNFKLGTIPELSFEENISAFYFMERENVELGKRKKFKAAFSANSNLLTQQLASMVLGYRSLLDYQLNQFVYHDGRRPYERAPDSQIVQFHYKDLTE